MENLKIIKMKWKSLKYEIEVAAVCKTEAVIKINKILGQMKLEWVGMNDVYSIDENNL